MSAPGIDQRLIDGRYARVEELGRGGFGIVWRAHDTLLERDVAIKEVQFPPVLDDEEQAKLRENVLREARAAARLSHPGLVTVFDVVEEDGRPFIVMELVQAPTLAERVKNEGPLSDREAAEIGDQVLDALATAHSHGIIHRDVKPANVMVSATGRVQLGDFGIASIIDDPKVTSSGHLAGSPSYMAPEQAHNRPAGPATDLWGLAATLYFAVEGEPPFEKDGAIPTLTSVVNDEPRPMQRATTLAPLLRDVLVKDPAARPPVEEVRRRLADIAAGAAAVRAPSPTLQLEPELLSTLTVTEDESAPPPAPASPPAPALDAPPSPPAPAPDAPPTPPPPPAPAAGTTAPSPASPPAPALDTMFPDPPAPGPPPLVRTRPRPPARREGPRPATVLVALAALLGLVLVVVLASRDPTPTTAPENPGTTAEPVVTEGSDSPDTRATTSADPGEWVVYRDPATGFTISYPPGWTVQREGTLTDFRDPASAAYLRVDYTTSPGPSPEQAWRDFEPSFAAENPNYRRIRIEPTRFKGYPAAIWEFTYTGRGTPLRAIDLGFVTGPYGFALNFQTRAEDWNEMQDVFEAFKESFQPPSA